MAVAIDGVRTGFVRIQAGGDAIQDLHFAANRIQPLPPLEQPQVHGGRLDRCLLRNGRIDRKPKAPADGAAAPQKQRDHQKCQQVGF